jgi:hypothetical protein
MTDTPEPTPVPCPKCGETNWTATLEGTQVWTLDTTTGLGLFFYADPEDPYTISSAACDECHTTADANTLTKLTAAIRDPNWAWEI